MKTVKTLVGFILGFFLMVTLLAANLNLSLDPNLKTGVFQSQAWYPEDQQAGFFSSLIKAISGAFSSVFGGSSSGSGSGSSGNSGNSGSGSNVYVAPPPAPKPVVPNKIGLTANVANLELPNADTPKIADASCIVIKRDVAGNKNPNKLVDQGSNLPGEKVTGAPLAEAVPLNDTDALKKNGEPAEATTSSFQVFVPTNSETELSCFRGMSKATKDELSLTINPCPPPPPPPPPSTGGVWINTVANGESQAAACARIKSKPYTDMDNCGICASAESRPMNSCGNASTIVWPSMPGKYAAFQGGGGQYAVGDKYCYKKLPWGSWNQKQDSDSTDRIFAWRCVDPTPPPPPPPPVATTQVVRTDCSKIRD